MRKIPLSHTAQIARLENGQLIVLIAYENLNSESDRPRNIFRVSEDGAIQWQVADYASIPSLSTFTNIQVREDGLCAFNFDGGLYRIDPSSGAILSSELVK
jgi:hypothetical protein